MIETIRLIDFDSLLTLVHIHRPSLAAGVFDYSAIVMQEIEKERKPLRCIDRGPAAVFARA